MKDLFQRVLDSEPTKQAWRTNYESIEFREASQVNKILVGLPLNQSVGCECVEDLFILLKSRNINQTINTMSNKLFKLKPGQMIMLHGCQPLTNDSTDEQLMALLKLAPNQIVKFESYPSDWEKLVGAKAKVSKQVPTVEEVVEEVVETPTDTIVQEDDSLSKRETELLGLSNGKLKDLLTKIGTEIPKKINKVNLVNAILEAEAKG